MSRQELHDLLSQLKQESTSVDIVESEHQQRLDEIIESLEQQKLYPDTFDQYSSLDQQIREVVSNYEAEHPTVQAILNSVQQVLNSFKP